MSQYFAKFKGIPSAKVPPRSSPMTRKRSLFTKSNESKITKSIINTHFLRVPKVGAWPCNRRCNENFQGRDSFYFCSAFRQHIEKNGFVTATKLGTTNEFFVASTKNFAAATKRLLIERNILLLWQNIFVIPTLTNDFVGITKPFFPCKLSDRRMM